MSVVEGFAGIRVNEKGLFVNPILPEGWNEYAFNMLYRENPLRICVKPNSIELINKSDHSIKVHVFGEEILIESNQTISRRVKDYFIYGVIVFVCLYYKPSKRNDFSGYTNPIST